MPRPFDQELLCKLLDKRNLEGLQLLARETDTGGHPLVDFNNVSDNKDTALTYLLRHNVRQISNIENYIAIFTFLAQMKDQEGNPVIDFHQHNKHSPNHNRTTLIVPNCPGQPRNTVSNKADLQNEPNRASQ